MLASARASCGVEGELYDRLGREEFLTDRLAHLR